MRSSLSIAYQFIPLFGKYLRTFRRNNKICLKSIQYYRINNTIVTCEYQTAFPFCFDKKNRNLQ